MERGISIKENYIAPALRLDAFHCPHCGTYAHQKWFTAYFIENNSLAGLIKDLAESVCQKCYGYTLWVKDKMVYPQLLIAPLPNDDMPEGAKADYNEARSIVNLSPRAACALLRLALQKIMIALGENGDLNSAIGNLVKKGMPEEIQQALDCIRVIGNNAVHPLELNIDDDVETAAAMFGLLNMIVQHRFTQPKEVKALYGKLPQKAIAAVAKRDAKIP